MEATNEHSMTADRTRDWPELLSKTVDDLSRISRREMDLFESKLGLLLDAQTKKITAGCCINAEMERQTACDTTTGPCEPMGRRGAKMADTVANDDGGASDPAR